MAKKKKKWKIISQTIVETVCILYGPNVHIPLNSYAEIVSPKVMVLGNCAFERWLGGEGGALIIGISGLIKETPKSSLVPSAMWGHNQKLAVCNQEEGAHWNLTVLSPWPPISSLQNCE